MIDLNCWLGNWPFQRFHIHSAAELAQHLRMEGISRALVSHLGAVFYADTDAYNRDLIEACSGLDELLPTPLINPAIPGWQRNLDDYQKLTDIYAVRLLPSFHNYELYSDSVHALIEELSARGLPLLLQMRMQDERNAFHALQVQAPSIETVIRLNRAFPDFNLVCLSIYLPEAQQLGRDAETVSVGISFADWLFTLEELLKDMPADRVFFGSHTPLLYTGAITRKLLDSEISDENKAAIGYYNAIRRFGIRPD